MPTINSRREQMFPKLTPQEIDRIRRFGAVQRYAKGALLLKTGEVSPGMFVLISGTVAVCWRDGLAHKQPIVEQGPGEFLAEVSQLSGRPSLVDASAKTDVAALLIPTAGLRALLIAEAEIGERIMRALILRRVILIEAGAGGPVLIGPATSPDVIRLQGFLARNHYPHQLVDPEEDEDAKALVERYVVKAIRPASGRVRRWDHTEMPERGGTGSPTRHAADRSSGSNLRRCRRRCGARGPCDRGLRRLRGPVGDRIRCSRLWRAGGGQRPHRKLSRISSRHLRPGPGGTCLCAGAEVRDRYGHSGRGDPSRLHRLPTWARARTTGAS